MATALVATLLKHFGKNYRHDYKMSDRKIPCEKLIDAEAHYTATFNSQGLYITISRKPQTKIAIKSGQIITDEATKISFPLTLPSNFYAISRAAYQLADNIHDNTEKLKAIYKNESLFNGLLQPLQHIIGESQTELDITKAINTWNALIKTNTQKNQHKKRKKKAKKHNKVVKRKFHGYQVKLNQKPKQYMSS